MSMGMVLNLVIELKKVQPDDKPGYVGHGLPRARGLPMAFRHLSEPDVATTALAAYPPTMGEQPLNAGILGLATHKACGAAYHYVAR